jgi:hypothetical protein
LFLHTRNFNRFIFGIQPNMNTYTRLRPRFDPLASLHCRLVESTSHSGAFDV